MSDDNVIVLRVLVVEDEPLIGLDIEDAVEALGHKVVGPIAELSAAMDRAADEVLDCAILDINIRGGSSYTVADLLLMRGIPLLFLSGYGTQTLPERWRQEARLAKPFTGEQLAHELRSLFNRASSERPSQ